MRPTLAHRLRRLRSLSPDDLKLLLRITGILLVAPPILKWLSLPRFMKLLDPGEVAAAAPQPPRSRIIELTQRLLAQRVGIFQPNCLKQSLVLFRLLRKAGDPVILRFGISKEGEAFMGHCWLEDSGQPIAEKGDPYREFAVIYSFPETAGQG